MPVSLDRDEDEREKKLRSVNVSLIWQGGEGQKNSWWATRSETFKKIKSSCPLQVGAGTKAQRQTSQGAS